MSSNVLILYLNWHIVWLKEIFISRVYNSIEYIYCLTHQKLTNVQCHSLLPVVEKALHNLELKSSVDFGVGSKIGSGECIPESTR